MGFETVLALFSHGFRLVELRQLGDGRQDGLKVRIRAEVVSQSGADVVYRERNAVDKVFFSFKVSAEAVSPQYLQQAEQDKLLQIVAECILVDLGILLE